MAATKAKTSNGKATAAPAPAVAAGMAVAMMPWSVGSRMATAWLEGVTRMNGEWARFVADRLAKDAETQHEIFSCGSPVEAQRLGAEFMHRAVNDYVAEAARISSMGIKVAQETGMES